MLNIIVSSLISFSNISAVSQMELWISCLMFSKVLLQQQPPEQ